MKLRPIENDEGLNLLIRTILERKKEPFFLAELVEEVFENKAFNKYCSKSTLQVRTAEVLVKALNAKIIKHYPQYPFSGRPKFVVI